MAHISLEVLLTIQYLLSLQKVDESESPHTEMLVRAVQSVYYNQVHFHGNCCYSIASFNCIDLFEEIAVLIDSKQDILFKFNTMGSSRGTSSGTSLVVSVSC